MYTKRFYEYCSPYIMNAYRFDMARHRSLQRIQNRSRAHFITAHNMISTLFVARCLIFIINAFLPIYYARVAFAARTNNRMKIDPLDDVRNLNTICRRHDTVARENADSEIDNRRGSKGWLYPIGTTGRGVEVRERARSFYTRRGQRNSLIIRSGRRIFRILMHEITSVALNRPRAVHRPDLSVQKCF